MTAIVKNIEQEFDSITKYWKPQDVFQFNDMVMKIAKLKGEYEWHTHEFEEKLFIVLDGQLMLETKDKTFEVNKGEVIKVPKMVAHRPYALVEAHVMFLERVTE